MARLTINTPTGQTQLFEIRGSIINIGRGATNDLVLNHPSVSRHHARLTVLPGDTTLLIDLGSLNGLFVNGQQVQEFKLADQDRVGIGMYDLKFETAAEQPLHVEAGSKQLTDARGLLGTDTLQSALRIQVEAGVPAKQAVQDRLRLLEQENTAAQVRNPSTARKSRWTRSIKNT